MPKAEPKPDKIDPSAMADATALSDEQSVTELKEISAKRAATVSRVAPADRAEMFSLSAKGAPIPPMFVIDGDADTALAAATYEQAQEELRKQHEAMMAVKSEMLDKEYTFFIKCRNSHPEGLPQHGIYLKGYIHGRTVRGDEWKSGYKPQVEAPWHGDEILCQVCLRYMNVKRPLDVVPVRGNGLPPGSFEIVDRWYWKRPKDPRRLAVENETRVRMVAWGTGNAGIAEANQRAQEAGLEVVIQ